MFLSVLFGSARKAHLAIFTLKTIKTYNLRPIEPLIFSYMFFSTAKRTKSCRHLKIRGSAAPRAETDASRETAAGCARSGGALSRRGNSGKIDCSDALGSGQGFHSLTVSGKASILFLPLCKAPISLNFMQCPSAAVSARGALRFLSVSLRPISRPRFFPDFQKADFRTAISEGSRIDCSFIK